MRRNLLRIVMIAVVIVAMGSMAQAMSFTTSPFGTGFDFDSVTVQTDPTVLTVVYGNPGEEIVEVIRPAESNPDTTAYFEFNPEAEYPWALISQTALQVAVLPDQGYNGIDPDRLLFQEVTFLPIDPQQMSVFKIGDDLWGMRFFENSGMALTGELLDVDEFLSSVPEPSTLLLLGIGLLGFWGLRRRKKSGRVLKCTLLVLCLMAFTCSSAFATGDFNIGEIPPQTAWFGHTLELSVHSTELGPTAVLTMNLIHVPKGTVTFANGAFAYTPDAQDDSPFSVSFAATAAGKTLAQTVTVTPVPHVSAEEEVFGLLPVHALPNPESSDYILRNEIVSAGAEDFNHQKRATRTINLSGKTLVFQQGHANGLYDYHANDDIRQMNIYAETVIFRSPVHLPQTTVTIYARELRFEGNGSLNTTPLSLTTRPAQFQNGANGLPAGDVMLHIETFHADSGQPVRFILRGGNGQPAGLGQDGAAGRDGASCGGWYGAPANTFFAARLYSIEKHEDTCGNPEVYPLSGADAQSPGKPGKGGKGGKIAATLDLTGYSDNAGGVAGEKASDAHGGRGGIPNPAYAAAKFFSKPWEIFGGPNYTYPGKDAPAPNADIPVGPQGAIAQVGTSLSWLSPYAFRNMLAYLKDAYLYRYYDETGNMLAAYLNVLNAYQTSNQWTAIPDVWQAEFLQLEAEMQALQHRLASNLDYFGNPSGWVPMLSFEANKLAFEQEINSAVRVLYLAYWINHAAATVQQKINALTVARENAKTELTALTTHYNTFMESIPELQVDVTNLENQTAALQQRLQQRQEELLERAKKNVADRQKAPAWKQAVSVLGTVCSVFPVGQPAIGLIGAGLRMISKVDPNKPLSSTIEEIGKMPGAAEFKKYGEDCAQLGQSITNLPTELKLETIRGYVKTLQDKAAPVIAHVKQYQDVLKKVQIPEGAVKNELERLKASDTELNDLINDVANLLAQKDALAQKLAQSLQMVTTLSNEITHNLLSIDAFNKNIADGNAVLDLRATQYLQEMERRARERLLNYHYVMGKAYEYRLLRPYTGELNLTRLFDRFRDIAIAGGSTPVLSADDFDALKAVYEEQLATITAEIFAQYNANRPELSVPARLSLSAEELQRLNAGQPVTLNLMEKGVLPLSSENVRIVDFKVETLDVDMQGSGLWGYLDVYAEHSGLSRLKNKGKIALFKHYTETTESPLTWGARYDIYGNLDPIEPAAASQSLLRSLLTRAGIAQTNENMLLYSRPAAWADITITKETLMPSGMNMMIKDLRFKIQYDFIRQSAYTKTLCVQVANGLTPLVKVDSLDINGRGNGIGNFYRTYYRGANLLLEAPATYGMYGFARWTNQFGQTISTNQGLPISLSYDLTVRAEYAINPSSAEILVKQDETTLLPGAVYDFGSHMAGATVTVPFTLENPGELPFIVHSINLSSAQFVIVSDAFPVTVAPHGSLTFEIAYTPSATGTQTAAMVTIPNNDPYLQPYTFTVTGATSKAILHLTKAGTGQGTVIAGSQTCDADCNELEISLTPATALVLKAIPAADSVFVGFENISGKPVSETIYTTNDIVLKAIFNKQL